jgi:undecaprenyl-diphosphatase
LTATQSILLGLIQGFTEFLPVSSSGHLVLAQRLFGLSGDLMTFDIFVHTGTLLSVLVVFRSTIVSLAAGCFGALRSISARHVPIRRVYAESPEVRTVLAIIIGSVPAGIIGIAFKDPIERLFSEPIPVLFALAVTGGVLLATFLARRGSRRIGAASGLIVGIAQAVAIVPGISRSGATISTALFLGIDRAEAGVFSFLLSVPAVGGATVLAFRDLAETGTQISPETVILGTLSSFVSGILALGLLMRIIRSGKIGYFGYYCIALALAGGVYFIAMGS